MDLLRKDAIQEVTEKGGFYSPLFVIPKKIPWRPIINLKHLNRFLDTTHLKMEGVSSIKDVLREQDWMTKIDLKDAYLTVPILKHDRRFLRFRFTTNPNFSRRLETISTPPPGHTHQPVDGGHYTDGQTLISLKTSFSEGFIPHHWPHELHPSSSPQGSPLLQGNSETNEQGPQRTGVIRDECEPGHRSRKGPDGLERSPTPLEWQTNYPSNCFNDYHIGCVNIWMGGKLWGVPDTVAYPTWGSGCLSTPLAPILHYQTYLLQFPE